MTNVSAIRNLSRKNKSHTGRRRPIAKAICRTFVNGERPPIEFPTTPNGIHPAVLRETSSPWASRTIRLEISYTHMATNGTKADRANSTGSSLDRSTLVRLGCFGACV
jgi:hypothetical protein